MTMPRWPAGPTPTTPQRVGSQDHLSAVSAALSQEFAGRLDVVSIEGVPAQELAAFAEAQVRDVIAILAIGRARLRRWAWASGRPGGGPMTR
jgi:nucleotide-binding universal stress UspA family protein